MLSKMFDIILLLANKKTDSNGVGSELPVCLKDHFPLILDTQVKGRLQWKIHL